MDRATDLATILEYVEDDEFADFVRWIGDDGRNSWSPKLLKLTAEENDQLEAYMENVGPPERPGRVDIIDAVAATVPTHIYGAICRVRNRLRRKPATSPLTDRQRRFLAEWYRAYHRKNISKARDD